MFGSEQASIGFVTTACCLMSIDAMRMFHQLT